MTRHLDFVRTLSTVIDLAAEVINRPTTASRITTITDLALIVDAERSAVVEGGAVIRAEATALLDVLGQIESERMTSSGRANRWCMVAGVLLPMVRENLADALTRRPQISTTDHDFSRGKK